MVYASILVGVNHVGSTRFTTSGEENSPRTLALEWLIRNATGVGRENRVFRETNSMVLGGLIAQPNVGSVFAVRRVCILVDEQV